MKYKMPLFFVTLLLFSLTSTGLNFPAKIHPALEEPLAQMSGQSQNVIIKLADRYDKVRLERELGLSQYAREAAHGLAIQALQDHSRRSQERLLQFLERESVKKNVGNFKGFWLDNLIWASLRPELLDSIAAFPEVEMIYPDPEISLMVVADEFVPLERGTIGVGDNLKAIGADSAWKMGYTGAGTLICTFDTGIEGDHPALQGSYRGTAGYAYQQCWFDPIARDTFPHIFTQIASKDFRQHGTFSMGLIVGKDDVGGDTTGVAFNAHWISAGVIDIPNPQVTFSYYLMNAFQWAADPDGDPNTAADVPDVLSNSWGYLNSTVGCTDAFYGVIDNLEALGVVVMFSAGNSGPSYHSLTNPANRADNPYNTFAVGMISNDYEDIIVDPVSSRGPSDCNLEFVKPNVVAPGRSVPSTIPFDMYPDSTGYGSMTGTSFSCPQAAGAALLLRQKNPNAPVDSIKKALMTTALDIAQPGPDSAAGYGLINIPAALEALAPVSAPGIYVSAFSQSLVEPDDTAQFYVTLRNRGLGVANLEGVLRTAREDVTIIDSSADFGIIPAHGSADNSAGQFRVYFYPGILDGDEVAFTLHLSGSDSYSTEIPLYLLVGTEQAKDTFTISVGAFDFTISNFGKYGLAPGSMLDMGGVGFVYPRGNLSNVFEFGILLSTDSLHISNSVRNGVNSSDLDFKVAPGGELVVSTPDQGAAQKTVSRFADDYARRPLGIEITQETYAFDDEDQGHFMIFVYILKNKSTQPLEALKVSLYADWDMYGGSGLADRTGLSRESQTGYMWVSGGNNYRGITILNEEGIISYRSILSDRNGPIYDGFSNPEKWQFISEGFIDTASTYAGDFSNLITTGPFNILPGETDTAAFAIVAADSQDELLALYAPLAQQFFSGSEPQDTIPPIMTLDIFPNSVIPFELDIYAHANEDLRENPQLTVQAPNQTKILTMAALDEHDLLTYVKDYQVEITGLHVLTVCGTDSVFNDSCTELEFSAGMASSQIRTFLDSPTGLFQLDIPADVISGKGLLIMRESAAEESNNLVMTDTYDFQPLYNLEISSQVRLIHGSALLSANLNLLNNNYSDSCCAALAKMGPDDTYEIIGLQREMNAQNISAGISEFGKYLLGRINKGGSSLQLPGTYTLQQNAPNPFNAETMIAFSLPEQANARLEVFNILGQKVKTVLDSRLEAGYHTAFWDGRNDSGDNVGTGIYFYRLQTEHYTAARRMLLLK